MAELPEQDNDEPQHDRPPDPVNAALPNQNENQQIVSDDGTEFPRLAMHYSPAHYLLPHQQQAIAMAQYYEARMRDHAAAYASAAAGAAWAAAQIAASSRLPPTLPIVEPPPFLPPYLHQAYPTEFAFGSSQSHHNNHSSASVQENITHDERPVKRHHKMPNSIDIDSQERRGRRRQRVDGSSSSDGGRFQIKSKRQNPHPNHRSNQYHYQSQSKRRDKINLLQKTAVSALHEWCVHEKKQPPKFVLTAGSSDGFCFTVYVDDLEWSRGRGATKASAKQDAAQKALQALVPGVVFDDSGLVVAIKLSHPKSDCKNKADTAHDAFEALPNLAERLAIDATKKRRCNIYPETTTTTDDDGDDENAYYANRGASVCSALLHALWQIDDRIPEPPSYTYDIPPSGISKEGARPSSFSCTATLKLQSAGNNSEFSNHQEKEGDDDPETDRREKAQSLSITDKDRYSIFNCHGKDNISIQILSAVGLGTTKRDARHVASAKLLARLFPECEGMVEVKAAAEAAREKYAKSKALKHQSKRNVTGSNVVPKANILPWPCSPSLRSHWLAQSSDPHLPTSTVEWMKSLLNYSSSANNDLSHVEEVSVESLTLSESKESIPSITHHPRDMTKQEKLKTSDVLLRQIQWENIVDHALQSLNELDDDGRSLPIDPDYEDIGRLVLRRGDANDSVLFHKHRFAQESRHDNSPLTTSQASCQSEAEGPPFSITVFMCRAIALHDEAPLGYAMLTLGFSLEKGKILRLTDIGSEPHLPRERFVERLQLLAVHMKCQLDTGIFHHKKSTKVQRRIVTTPQLRDIVESFHSPKFSFSDESGSKLQSVKEEENEIEDDINDKERLLLSLKDKPSKRSRID